MSIFIEWFQNNPVAVATIAAAIIAICGVIISAFSAFLTGRRAIYISSVTTERSKWIDKLRSNIADLIRVCAAIHNEKEDREVQGENRNKADGLVALIELQLNPADNDGIDKNLIKHIKILIKSADKKEEGYRTEEKNFVRHSQFMLKEEWEKVKSEARGWIAAFVNFLQGKKRKRKNEYKKFLEEELKWSSSDN